MHEAPVAVPLVVVAVLGSLAVFAGIRRRRPRHPLGWWLIGVGALGFSAEPFVPDFVTGSPTALDFVAEAVVAAAACVAVVGLMVIARQRSPSLQVPGLLDAALLAVGAGYINWLFLTGPAVARATSTLAQTIIVTDQLIDLVLIGLVVRLLLTEGGSSTSLWLLSAGYVSHLVGDLGEALPAGLRAAEPVTSVIAVASVVLIGAAAVHPSMVRVASRVETEREGAGRLRLGFFGLVIQLPILAAIISAAVGRGIPATPSVTMASFIGPLIALRVVDLATRLQRLALSDSLTGLASRELLIHRLDDATEQARLQPGRAGLLFVDLDHFKEVNDTLGHQAGDQILVEATTRLLGVVRGRDTVARLGGDEFAILCESLHEDGGVEALAARVVSVMADPFTVDATQVYLGASVGVLRLDSDHSPDVHSSLRNADLAMYSAKAAGRGRWMAFDPSMLETLAEQVSLDNDIRRALDRGEMRLVFQPIVDLSDERVLGVEALLRWRHPTRGEVPPAVAVPALERLGLIGSVGTWALTEALQTVADWRAGHGGRRLRIAVNVSTKQFASPAFATTVASALFATRTNPSDLCLEITETAFIEDHAAFTDTLVALNRLGVELALDDFGTGFSTLAQAVSLPVRVIKIDRSFVAQLGVRGSRHGGIVAAVISMARETGMTVVAEGVETAGQADELRRLGCQQAQGYLFSRPLERDQLDALQDVAAQDRTVSRIR